MISRRQLEAPVGLMVVAGLFVAAFSAYTRPARQSDGSMTMLIARFERTDGLRLGSPVRMSGIAIGQVAGLDLMPDFRVRARLALRPDLAVPEDSSAAIRSDGFLGGRHVALEPGGSDVMLAPGGAIAHTQGALVIDDLLDRIIERGQRLKAKETQ